MDRESAKLAQALGQLARQLRSLEAKLTSADATLTLGEFYLEGEHIEMEALADLKSALDHARHSVWAVLESLSEDYGQSIEEALQEYRMQRATELLHALRKQVDSPIRPNTAVARSFFEEVQVVADLAVTRNLRAKR